MKRRLLGGLSARTFLARHWQKRPLLVRGALPGFRGLVSRSEMFRLAARDDVESRLVERHGSRWSLKHGPFPRGAFKAMPPERWTLLVQGLNLHIPAADALLRAFDFLPYARLDDVMVSYAAPGGGVGPHFDSYDVFLLQGPGRRRWRVSGQKDRDLDPRAPLRILRRFRSETEWVLEPGDMLYLPPGYAHDGTALDECTTYSIGFRAPSANELGSEFLAYLQERLDLPGMYEDADLAPLRHPARLDDRLVERAAGLVAGIRWSRADFEDFLGRYLSEPKASVLFDPPEAPLSKRAFAAACRRSGLQLSPKTIVLFRGRALFVNGDRYPMPAGSERLCTNLADRRNLPPAREWPQRFVTQIFAWYRLGYLFPGPQHHDRDDA